jgi:hypothetical protein
VFVNEKLAALVRRVGRRLRRFVLNRANSLAKPGGEAENFPSSGSGGDAKSCNPPDTLYCADYSTSIHSAIEED